MTGASLQAWLSGGGSLLLPWRAVLWAAVAYLLALGVSVLVRPRLARSFLDGFARGWRNNLLEAVLRGLVGLAFVAAAGTTRAPEASRVLGLFLVATAILIAILPRVHARLAGPATRLIFAVFPLFGVLAIGLGVLLAWFISPR